MKIRYLKLKNWFLVSLMSLFGLSSCHCHKEMEKSDPTQGRATSESSGEKPKIQPRQEIRLMYGVPTMNYMVRGQVKNADGQPVKGIRVNMLERGMEVKDGRLVGEPEKVQLWLDQNSVSTDGEGRFEIKTQGLPQENVRLLVRDVDGPENGDLKDQLLNMPVQQGDVDREGSGGWNQGSFNKKVEIELENK